MTASLVTDALQGFGCVTFSFALIAGAALALALRVGLFPGLTERLKQLGTAAPPKDPDGGRDA